MTKNTHKNKLEANNKALEPKTVNILGVKVAIADEERVLSQIKNQIRYSINNGPKSRPFFVVTVNPEFVMQAQDDDDFRQILNSANLAIADGRGLKLANPEITTVPGRRLVQKLVGMGYRVFYLGGRSGVAELMAKQYGGEWNKGHEEIKVRNASYKAQDTEIIKKVNEYKPDILLVAYGAPWQEKWIYEHLDELETKVVMGVGGTFDYLTGRAKLPPEWVASLGLEWLWRLLREPWRWRRQIRLIKYFWMVMRLQG